MSEELTGFITASEMKYDMTFSNGSKAVMTVTHDGKLSFADDVEPKEIAAAVILIFAEHVNRAVERRAIELAKKATP